MINISQVSLASCLWGTGTLRDLQNISLIVSVKKN